MQFFRPTGPASSTNLASQSRQPSYPANTAQSSPHFGHLEVYVILLVRLEFELKLEPLLLYSPPTPPPPAPPPAPAPVC